MDTGNVRWIRSTHALAPKLKKNWAGDGVSGCLEYEMPGRTCSNVKQTMNDATLNV